MTCPPVLAALTVFTSGAAILIIEIAGLKLLAPAFGSSFHVWTGQIGIVMVALAFGYWLGGLLIDRAPHVRTLAMLLLLGGLGTIFIPSYTRPLADAIAGRHFAAQTDDLAPWEQPPVEIPRLWQRLDPMLGSAAAFFLPCLLLAGVSPVLVRLLEAAPEAAGVRTGRVLAWGTFGSIFGIFATAYWLIDAFPVPAIIQGTGGVLIALGLFWSLWRGQPARVEAS